MIKSFISLRSPELDSPTTMLLRSSSMPLLNSLCAKDSHLDLETNISVSISVPRIHRNRSVSMTSNESTRRIGRALSESNLVEMRSPVVRNVKTSRVQTMCAEEEDVSARLNKMFTSGLMEEDEGCGVGNGGGRINCGGGGGGLDGDDFGRARNWDPDHGNSDAYYQSMIQANPGNSLVLSNYAKYLKEVRGDLVKAEEYCGRAILADRTDGDMLAFYADLVWETHKDAPRAETYFDQAVKAAPDDCYVMASYAKFLWDAEEEELNSDSALSTTSANMRRGFEAEPCYIVAAS